VFGCSEESGDRSGRAGVFRLRVGGAEPAAGADGEGAEPTDGGESAASLAAERVILATVAEAPAEEDSRRESSRGSWR
jgi:hypothetical protein